MRERTVGGIAACLVCLAACGDGALPLDVDPPELLEAGVEANEHNVLSAVVTVRARAADSVVVRFRPAGNEAMVEEATPAVPFENESATVPLLGLLAERRYVAVTVLYGEGGMTIGAELAITTGSLPPDLRRYIAAGADPSPGYVLLTQAPYALVLDNSGRVVWYRRFPDGPGLNFMAQPTGHYVVRPPTPDLADIEPWLVLDALGNVERELRCADGLQSRLHDLILLEDGGYWILCDEVRTMDLRSVGGLADARVVGTAVQHVAADGSPLFRWSPFDHFAITDVEAVERSGAVVNWTHGNGIDLDENGDLLVSFRTLNEITKIAGRTGEVRWRLGGLRNQFALEGSTTPAFARQHSVRRVADDALVLLDNVGDPAASRAERYEVDEAARTVRLAKSYGSIPAVVTQIGGSVQPLANGRLLVSFGTAGRVEEYDADGRLVWRIEGNPGYVFRAQRITSLYAPGVGTSR